MWRLIDFGLITPINIGRSAIGTKFHFMTVGDVKSDLLNIWLVLKEVT
jgi:hypothetical protein